MDKCWIEDVAFSEIRNPFWIGTTVHDIMIVSIVQLVGTCVCSRRHWFKSWRSLEVFTHSNLIDSAGNYLTHEWLLMNERFRYFKACSVNIVFSIMMFSFWQLHPSLVGFEITKEARPFYGPIKDVTFLVDMF